MTLTQELLQPAEPQLSKHRYLLESNGIPAIFNLNGTVETISVKPFGGHGRTMMLVVAVS